MLPPVPTSDPPVTEGHGSGEASADEDLSEPILPGTAPSDYERYLRTEELLALQKAPDEVSHRDELLFQTVHQSSELWLKLASAEVEEGARLLADRQVAPALRLLRRAHDCMKNVMAALDMLEHMSPWEYTALIRPVLGHGSGFDSPGFREVRRVSPRLGDAFHRLRREQELTLLELYQRGREHEDLYQLAESLTEWDERVTLWRVRHFKVVERIIGAGAIGTQGTPVELLGRLIHSRMYPELWEVRNELTETAKRLT
jgi:tryptophan 2,3-dioxygenase